MRAESPRINLDGAALVEGAGVGSLPEPTGGNADVQVCQELQPFFQ